jgi:hypothetical protein
MIDLKTNEFKYQMSCANANTSLDVIVSYLVSPKKAVSTRSAILKNVVAALLQQHDKTLFPKGNS